MINILYISISFAMIIIVWLKTNVFIEYYNLFKMKWLEAANIYNKKNSSGFIENFPDYLRNNYNGFISNLLTCPICLSIWGGIISSIWVGINFLVVSFLCLSLYKIYSKYLTE